MIPYVTVHTQHLMGIAISPFRLLLAAAVLTGFALTVRQARRHGISRERIAALTLWLVLFGFAGSRLFKLVYSPQLFLAALSAPAGCLRSQGISSFGGIFGGCLGLLLFFGCNKLDRRSRISILDSLGFSMPFAWAIGRMGCALAHDHPGMRSTSALAVAFPGGARFDLGLLEVFFHLLLAAAFLYLRRSDRPLGFFFATFFCAYGPFRILLDRLHVNPPRYAGVPVDVYAGGTALLIGLLAVLAMRRSKAASIQLTEHPCQHAFSH
jgi:phosphatidylglycerol:prolipoprotein diacylglycerol transferase